MGARLKVAAACAVAQMFRECERPAWWPLKRWDKAQLDRQRPALGQVHAALAAQLQQA
jgi:predicted NUDIX family NTP pyrophosphohydrolase